MNLKQQPPAAQGPQRTAFVLLLALSACQTVSMESNPAQVQNQRAAIVQVIRDHQQDIESCYLHAIDERPGAVGRVVMSWQVEPDGKVSDVQVASSGPRITAIGPCLVSTIGAWRFPRLNDDGNVTAVTYPFHFSENGRFDAE